MASIPPQSGLSRVAPYVPGKPIEEVQREYGLQDVIKLASNENPFGPSPRAIAAMREALTRIHMYPDGESYELRQALARYLGVPADHIAVANGADGIIMQVCMAYLDDGDEVIVSRSSFPIYDRFTYAMRGRLIKVPTRNYGLDLEAMARAINERTRLVFVCNPNNPTGTIVSQAEVEAFMARLPDQVLVIFDEAYHDFVASDAYRSALPYVRAGRSNVMVMRTFSKVYGIAGLRLGYGVAVPELLAPLQRIREPFAVNLLAQVAGVAALEDEEFRQQTVAANHAGRLYLYQECERLGLNYIPSHTNFVLIEVGAQAETVVQRLLAEHGVIVRPCAGYDLPTFLRVTVGTPQQNQRFVAALEQVLRRLN